MKVQTIRYPLVGLCGVMAVVVVGFFSVVSAERFTGGSYIIDASVVGNSFGGSSTGGSYKLTSSGGESIIGQGSGGSYKLNSGYVAQLPRSMQLTVQPGGLVAYYPLDEPSGTAVYDRGAGGYTANATSEPARTTGKIGGALGYITGTTYPLTSETAAFNTSYLTVCSWVYKTAASSNPGIVSHADNTVSTNGMWILGYNNTQKPRFLIHLNGVDNLITAPVNISLSAWHHICGTYDGSNIQLYIDGVFSVGSALTGALPAVTQPLTIGARSGGGTIADTQYIDEVKVFNRAFTAEEIKAEYDGQNAGRQSGVALGPITPGTSSVEPYDAVVQTDAFGYSLALNQNNNLTKGADTISGIGGSIASPISWSEGATKGLGFSLISSNATAIDGKWNAGASYAALPGAATSVYTRTGSQSSKDVLNMRLRLDVTMAQPPGTYTNVMTTTATYTP